MSPGKQKMKIWLFTSLLALSSHVALSQGPNNDHPFDGDDLAQVLDMQGISAFKFPFELKRGEYVALSYEVWKNGALQETVSPFDEMVALYGGMPDHTTARTDTTLVQRLYALQAADSITLRLLQQGSDGRITSDKKIPRADVGQFTAALEIDPRLAKKTAILYYFGVFAGSEHFVRNGGFARCGTGDALPELLQSNDLVVAISAERRKQ
jgi:hypothetical protein